VDYTQAIVDLARDSMTDKGFKLLVKIEGKMVDIWDRPTSSTGKYHKKEDGSVPSNAHHTYEMLYAGVSILRMFGGPLISTQNDVYIMAIILHDMMKYGKNGNTPHTYSHHDKGMADFLETKRKLIKKHLSDAEFETLCMGVRYHSGRWSKSISPGDPFDFKDYPTIVMFMHTLDMLSTADCLKFPERE